MQKTAIAARRFVPRLAPRNKYDWRLIAVTYPLTLAVLLPLALAWMFGPMLLVLYFFPLSLLAPLTILVQWVLWMTFFLSPMIKQLAVTEDGVVVAGSFSTQLIEWHEIESVRVVTIGEMIKATLRWPLVDRNVKFSNSPFTFSEYIRVRHKHGTFYFSAENTEELLTVLLARNQTATPSSWYHAVQQTVETAPQVLYSRR